jgi:hypothetical protein
MGPPDDAGGAPPPDPDETRAEVDPVWEATATGALPPSSETCATHCH